MMGNQALDHEVDALLHVLKHNLRTVGTPIDGQPPTWSTSPYDSYAYLQENLMSYNDALGNSFLMPCRAQNPTQLEEVRKAHEHYMLDCLFESNAIHSKVDGRRHIIEIDNTRSCVTPQDVEAILTGFDTLREIVEVEVQKYALLGYQNNLVEYILQWDAINKYQYPLCFR